MRVRYYLKSSGRSPVADFIMALPEATRIEVVDAINMLSSGKTLKMPLSRSLSSIATGLHELRFRDRAGQVRLIYFIKKQEAIFLIHAFRKKTQELPRLDRDLVLKRLKEI